MAAANSNVLIAKGRLAVAEMLRALISLRDRPEFEGVINGTDLWMRVDCSIAKDAVRILALVPDAELFSLDERQRLTPINRSVPVGLLPNGLEWKPIGHLTRLWLPALLQDTHDNGRPADSSSSSALPMRLNLKWIPSKQFVAPGGMLCAFSDWSSYVLNNIHSKWQTLRFACRGESGLETHTKGKTSGLNTLVVGEPIPSIPGVRLVNCEQVLTPLAFTWSPGVPAQAIRRALRVAESDWLLWESEPSLEILLDSKLIATTRASVRATEAALTEVKESVKTEQEGP